MIQVCKVGGEVEDISPPLFDMEGGMAHVIIPPPTFFMSKYCKKNVKIQQILSCDYTAIGRSVTAQAAVFNSH